MNLAIFMKSAGEGWNFECGENRGKETALLLRNIFINIEFLESQNCFNAVGNNFGLEKVVSGALSEKIMARNHESTANCFSFDVSTPVFANLKPCCWMIIRVMIDALVTEQLMQLQQLYFSVVVVVSTWMKIIDPMLIPHWCNYFLQITRSGEENPINRLCLEKWYALPKTQCSRRLNEFLTVGGCNRTCCHCFYCQCVVALASFCAHRRLYTAPLTGVFRVALAEKNTVLRTDHVCRWNVTSTHVRCWHVPCESASCCHLQVPKFMSAQNSFYLLWLLERYVLGLYISENQWRQPGNTLLICTVEKNIW